MRTAATYESSGAWAQANPGRYAAARDAIEEVFRGYVIDCRAMAKASQAIAWTRAQAAYEAYLMVFPRGPTDEDLRIRYAWLVSGMHQANAAYDAFVYLRDTYPSASEN